MVAGEFDHVHVYVLQQFDKAGGGTEDHCVVVRRWRAVLGEGDLVADVGDVGLDQPGEDVLGGVGHAVALHSHGSGPAEGGHSGHHHHRRLGRIAVGEGGCQDLLEFGDAALQAGHADVHDQRVSLSVHPLIEHRYTIHAQHLPARLQLVEGDHSPGRAGVPGALHDLVRRDDLDRAGGRVAHYGGQRRSDVGGHQ